MQQRLEQLEKRMEKYEDLLEAVSKAVVRLEANSESTQKWINLAIAVTTTVGGILVGHFLH